MVGKPHIKTGKMRSDYLNFKFIWGKCWCGCGIDLPDVRYKWYLRRYIVNHKNRGKFGKDSAGYKTGITEDKSRGYATIIRRHHKYADKRGRVYLHRYLKELDLGRYITPEYDIHHIDGNTRNNAPENLMEILKSQHPVLEHTIDMKDRQCVICNRKFEDISELHRRQWYNNKTTCFYCYSNKRTKKSLDGGDTQPTCL